MKAVLTLALGMAIALPLMSAPAVGQPKGPAPMAAGDAAPRPWVRYGGWPTRDPAQFNTLAATQVSPPAPKEPRKLDRLVTGDASNGEKLVAEGYVLLNATLLGEMLTNCKNNGLGFSGG